MKNKVIAGFLASLLLASATMLTPIVSNAEEAAVLPTTVDYDADYLISEYWSKDNKTAPVKEGYVFGGWYSENQDGTYTPLKEANISYDETTGKATTENACAKFVPAYVLSVKTQIEAEAQTQEENKASTYLRVLSAVDSTSYQKVGFDIWYNKTIKEEDEADKTVLTTVYKTLKAEGSTISATEEFGSPATHFSVLKIGNIIKDNYKKVIYVRPYWVTMDGTRVEGLSKYVRIMDGYTSNQYISVPVNLLKGAAVAAGSLQLKYDCTTLEYVGIDSDEVDRGFDTGKLLPEMNYHVDATNGIIKMIGNASNYGADIAPQTDIYANVWFRVRTDVAKENIPEHWSFVINQEKFCTWGEQPASSVTAWDYRY